MRHNKKIFVKRSLQVFISSFVAVLIIGTFTFFTQGREIPVLDPSGTIADQQMVLILITVGLGFFVVIPVFILLFAIGWHYRASNKKAKYEPNLEGSHKLEIIWWGIPCLIIIALAIITYISTHALDPYKELESDKKPVVVQVISLNANWLFIYPEYNAATLNFMNIPEQTPINLSITSDAPMNAFWVPALAGQVYSMAGMTTKLHLSSNHTGTFHGSSTNISGPNYADMHFKVYAMTEDAFNSWAETASDTSNTLTTDSYTKLAKLQENIPPTTYLLETPSIFDDAIMKYMHSPAKTNETSLGNDHGQHGTQSRGMDGAGLKGATN